MAYRPMFQPASGVHRRIASSDPRMDDVAWTTKAILPPIDAPDRVDRIIPPAIRDDESAVEEDRRQQIGRIGSILAGLSGSTAMATVLYAPDLVTAIRRNESRRGSESQPRPASGRNEPDQD